MTFSQMAKGRGRGKGKSKIREAAKLLTKISTGLGDMANGGPVDGFWQPGLIYYMASAKGEDWTIVGTLVDLQVFGDIVMVILLAPNNELPIAAKLADYTLVRQVTEQELAQLLEEHRRQLQ